MDTTTTQRVCFQLQVRPDRLDDYRTTSCARSGPTCSPRCTRTGWRNYSLFLRDDGLLIGYFEAADSARRARRRWPPPRSTRGGRPRWPSSSPTSTVRPDEGFLRLDEVFHLEDQLGLPRPQRRTRHEHVRRHRRAPRGPGHRAAVVGVRQLRHPLQGVRHARARRARSQEKIADAAKVHEFTGLAPTVALHIPWDKVDDYAALRVATPRTSGVALGTINSNTFQDDDYKFGSLTHADERSGRRRSTTTSSASRSWTRPARGT